VNPDRVSGGSETLVFHLSGRQGEADQQAQGGSPDGQSERIVTRHANRLSAPCLRLVTTGPLVSGAAEEASNLIPLLPHGIADAGWDVHLVTERVGRLTHALTRLLYLVSDLVRFWSHSTSSFKVSWVCSGTGGKP
jgi:hypothetical protein